MSEIISSGLTSDEVKPSSNLFADTLNGLFASNRLMALSTAAVLAMSGASASAIANYSQTNYTASGLPSTIDDNGVACTSMVLSSTSDPTLFAFYDQKMVSSAEVDKSLSNFSTVYNTQGGSTTFSTVVGKLQPVVGTIASNPPTSGTTHTGPYDPAEVYNTSSTISHAGPNGWNVTANINGSGLNVTVKDASGNVVATSIPAGGLHLPDGSTVTMQTGSITVTQPLNQGGVVESTIKTGTGYWTNGTMTKYLDLAQEANGAVIINGAAPSLSVGADTPVLALPCTANLNAGATGGSESAELQANAQNNAPAPPPTPVPGSAQDTNGSAAQESM